MNNSLDTENQRFKILREHLGYSQSSFAQVLGRRQGSISDIERGRNSVDGIVQLLNLKFNVNESWLKTGEGEMFQAKKQALSHKVYWTEQEHIFREPSAHYGKSEFNGVPVYYDAISSGLLNNPDIKPVAWLNTPEFKGCDAVIQAKDDSMVGKISEKDWVGIKKVNNWQAFLPLGYMYAFTTADFELIRTLISGKTPDTLKLVSANSEYYSNEIDKSLIKEVWSIKAVLPYSKIETFL
jgi:transcriptional regulator with XRE-family HTH domain